MTDAAIAKPYGRWKTVPFGKAVRNITERAEPAAKDSDLYVGLEHLDSGSLTVRRWGSERELEGTKLRMQKGDVLFAKRNAYLKRVAIAPHDGLFSAHGMVLRANPELMLHEFLPFFMQSDRFWDRAIAISVGSLSPTINWTTLATEEFALPPIEVQRRMVKALSATADLSNSLANVSRTGASLALSMIDEIFTRSAARGDTLTAPLSSLCTTIVDGVHKRPDYVDKGIPFLTVENLTRGPGIDFADTRFITALDHAEFVKRTNPECGDVLISKDGTLGVPRVVETTRPFSIFVSVALVKPQRGVLDPWFLRFYFESSLFKRHISSRVAGSALKHIHLVDLRDSPVPVMSLDRQHAAVALLKQGHDAQKLCGQRLTDAGGIASSLVEALIGKAV